MLISLIKTLIIIALLCLNNCVDVLRTFAAEETITYGEEINTETEEYPLSANHEFIEITTGAKESVTDENYIKVVCPYFKDVGEINLQRMLGVWSPVYYQVPYNVPCFKMVIRIVNSKERNRYSKLYGDFNGKVVWDDCNLEIKSSTNLVYRKHFLQGCEKGFGILENIIIEQKGDAVPVLIEETADQWLAINQLLLMRDCMTGDIVIFSGEDYQPKLYDVLKTMEIFGNISRVEMACNEGSTLARRQPFDGEFESDNDIVFFE